MKFKTENQPSITVMGGMGKSYSVMSVQNQGPYWEPMIRLGHRNEKEGVVLSIFKGIGNVIATNHQGESLRLDASQGNSWRRVVWNPFSNPSLRPLPQSSSVPYSNIRTRP